MTALCKIAQLEADGLGMDYSYNPSRNKATIKALPGKAWGAVKATPGYFAQFGKSLEPAADMLQERVQANPLLRDASKFKADLDKLPRPSGFRGWMHDMARYEYAKSLAHASALPALTSYMEALPTENALPLMFYPPTQLASFTAPTAYRAVERLGEGDYSGAALSAGMLALPYFGKAVGTGGRVVGETIGGGRALSTPVAKSLQTAVNKAPITAKPSHWMFRNPMTPQSTPVTKIAPESLRNLSSLYARGAEAGGAAGATAGSVAGNIAGSGGILAGETAHAGTMQRKALSDYQDKVTDLWNRREFLDRFIYPNLDRNTPALPTGPDPLDPGLMGNPKSQVATLENRHIAAQRSGMKTIADTLGGQGYNVDTKERPGPYLDRYNGLGGRITAKPFKQLASETVNNQVLPWLQKNPGKVLAGAGGLGSAAILYLAAAGLLAIYS